MTVAVGTQPALACTNTSSVRTLSVPSTGYANMDGQSRSRVPPGTAVGVVQKEDQPTGRLTWGTVGEILTGSPNHHRGIKVRLREGGVVGRVQRIGREPDAAAASAEPQKTLEEWMAPAVVRLAAPLQQQVSRALHGHGPQARMLMSRERACVAVSTCRS